MRNEKDVLKGKAAKIIIAIGVVCIFLMVIVRIFYNELKKKQQNQISVDTNFEERGDKINPEEKNGFTEEEPRSFEDYSFTENGVDITDFKIEKVEDNAFVTANAKSLLIKPTKKFNVQFCFFDEDNNLVQKTVVSIPSLRPDTESLIKMHIYDNYDNIEKIKAELCDGLL